MTREPPLVMFWVELMCFMVFNFVFEFVSFGLEKPSVL